MLSKTCKRCRKKFGFSDNLTLACKIHGLCLNCIKEKSKQCRICGKKLSFWKFEQDFAKNHDFMCQNCWNAYATPEQKANLASRTPSTFSVMDFVIGKETVAIIAKGDAEFKMAMLTAEKHSYELINMTQSQDNWSFLETKRTLIFKKKKEV